MLRIDYEAMCFGSQAISRTTSTSTLTSRNGRTPAQNHPIVLARMAIPHQFQTDVLAV